MSGVDDDAVLVLRDDGGRPGDPLSFLSLGPRAHLPPQDDLVALRLDGDALGIRLGAAYQRLLDLALELRGQGPGVRFDGDQVGYAAGPSEAAREPLGVRLLERPLDLAA